MKLELSDSEAVVVSSAQCHFRQSVWNYLDNVPGGARMYKNVNYQLFESNNQGRGEIEAWGDVEANPRLELEKRSEA